MRKPKKLPGVFFILNFSSSNYVVYVMEFVIFYLQITYFLSFSVNKRLFWYVAGKVISQEYILEYGRDCLEMHVGAVEPGERA